MRVGAAVGVRVDDPDRLADPRAGLVAAAVDGRHDESSPRSSARSRARCASRSAPRAARPAVTFRFSERKIRTPSGKPTTMAIASATSSGTLNSSSTTVTTAIRPSRPTVYNARSRRRSVTGETLLAGIADLRAVGPPLEPGGQHQRGPGARHAVDPAQPAQRVLEVVDGRHPDLDHERLV